MTNVLCFLYVFFMSDICNICICNAYHSILNMLCYIVVRLILVLVLFLV